MCVSIRGPVLDALLHTRHMALDKTKPALAGAQIPAGRGKEEANPSVHDVKVTEGRANLVILIFSSHVDNSSNTATAL